jgi:site-specific recombinase XerD
MAKELAKAVDDYLVWMIAVGYASGTIESYENALNHFQNFINRRKIRCDDVFTYDTLKAFEKESGLTHVSASVKGLSRYLFQQKRIPRPIEKQTHKLPEIYEEYLNYYAKIRQVQQHYIMCIRKVLSAFNDYLKRENIRLSLTKIEQLDAFLAEYNARFMPVTHRKTRTYFRGFLKYLYHERKILNKDFAPMLIGAPLFAQSKPPKFFRPHEVKQLFYSLSTSSLRGLRSAAMIHLAYTLGLRPREISLISLDDIFFRQSEIRLPDRKSNNPINLPLPEVTIKAIAAYVVGARPKSDKRKLFLNLFAPYEPVSPASVSSDITACIRKAGLCGSAYWLRHTYAQSLLESGISIFEIKEMMGHDRIGTTRRYLHIHTKLMRRVLFDETF